MHFIPGTIAIGSSTGGPEALLALFTKLKGRLDHVPVFITQHTPAKATRFLAQQISKVSGYHCAEAVDGEPVVNGRIYLAPGDYHMVVENRGNDLTIAINQDPEENFCRPAIDPMVRSIASIYGSSTLFIIMTGMGKDGLDAAKAVKAMEGRVVAQNEETSVVWGMPGTVVKAGLCNKILSLTEIGDYLCQILP